jgi:hypothetical protein
MTTSAVMPQPLSELKRPKNEWCYFLLANLDEFARLAWYLVVDNALVDCVMLRAVARLERIPFAESDAQLTYNQARDAVVGEAIAVLNLPQQGYVDAGGCPPEAVGLCELPDLPRLAFLLKLVLLMPENRVARLLNVPSSSVPELIGFAICRLSRRLADSNARATAAA